MQVNSDNERAVAANNVAKKTTMQQELAQEKARVAAREQQQAQRDQQHNNLMKQKVLDASLLHLLTVNNRKMTREERKRPGNSKPSVVRPIVLQERAKERRMLILSVLSNKEMLRPPRMPLLRKKIPLISL